MGIKNRLTSLLKEKGMNINELASKIDVTPSTLYSIVQRDSTRIDIDLILKIAHALGVTADEMVEEAPSIASVIRDFDSFIGSDNLVGHNLPFDLGFLDYAGSDYFSVKRKYYDTLNLAKLLNLSVRDNKLTTLCEHFYIRDNSSAHRSASDALAAGLLFKKLVDLKTV